VPKRQENLHQKEKDQKKVRWGKKKLGQKGRGKTARQCIQNCWERKMSEGGEGENGQNRGNRANRRGVVNGGGTKMNPRQNTKKKKHFRKGETHKKNRAGGGKTEKQTYAPLKAVHAACLKKKSTTGKGGRREKGEGEGEGRQMSRKRKRVLRVPQNGLREGKNSKKNVRGKKNPNQKLG